MEIHIWAQAVSRMARLEPHDRHCKHPSRASSDPDTWQASQLKVAFEEGDRFGNLVRPSCQAGRRLSGDAGPPVSKWNVSVWQHLSFAAQVKARDSVSAGNCGHCWILHLETLSVWSQCSSRKHLYRSTVDNTGAGQTHAYLVKQGMTGVMTVETWSSDACRVAQVLQRVRGSRDDEEPAKVITELVIGRDQSDPRFKQHRKTNLQVKPGPLERLAVVVEQKFCYQ